MSAYNNIPSHIRGVVTQLCNYMKNNSLKTITIEDEELTFVYLSNIIMKYNADGTSYSKTLFTQDICLELLAFYI